MNKDTLIKRLKKNKASQKTYEDTCRRVDRILRFISDEHPHLVHYNQIKLMHCQDFKDQFLVKCSEATRLDYVRALRLLVLALGKEHWLVLLKIDTHTGAPTKMGVVKSTKRTVKHVKKRCSK